MRRFLSPLTVLTAALAAGTAFSQVSVTNVGTGNGSFGSGLSGNGQWAAGNGAGAFRWSAATGTQVWLDPTKYSGSGFTRVANDGSLFATYEDPATLKNTACIFSPTGVPNFLPTLGSSSGSSATTAYGLSDDASTAAGLAWVTPGTAHAFKWSQATGTVDLGSIFGASSRANSVSGNGRVTVGWDTPLTGGRRATYWDVNNVAHMVGTAFGEFYGANRTGAVLVGEQGGAMQWTEAGGMVPLGSLPGVGGTSYADDVSNNGQTIVGSQGTGPVSLGGWRAFIWRPEVGLVKLDDLVAALGGASGWTFYQAFQVSDDGLTIAGTALPPGAPFSEAFALTLPPISSAYCTAKVNSQNCTPSIGSVGTPSASEGSGFHINADNLVPNKVGILLYSTTGSQAVPFSGGTLCLAGQIKRTPPVSSGGSTPCTGQFDFDFNAFIPTSGNAALSAGAHVWAQFWGRDGQASFGTTLTDGLAFQLWP